MIRFKMKAVSTLLSALMVGSAALPAMAVSTQQNISTSVLQDGTMIEPRTTTFPLATTSYSTRIKVSWTRPSGATKYIATCGGQSQTLNSTSEYPSTYFSGLSSNTNYYITVTAYNSSGAVIAVGSTTVSTT